MNTHTHIILIGSLFLFDLKYGRIRDKPVSQVYTD